MAIDICTKALNSAGETLDTSLMAGYDLTSHGLYSTHINSSDRRTPTAAWYS